MMITTSHSGERIEIRRTDPNRHKYADALAEYIDTACYLDTYSGDVESPTGWFALVGRRIIVHDSRGFVHVETFPEPWGALQVYDAMDALYCAWANDDEDDIDARAATIDELERHLGYVIACALENLDAHTMAEWRVHGRPTGPLG